MNKKLKEAAIGFGIVIAALFIANVFGVLASQKETDRISGWFTDEYPTVMPAGYCLVTNGTYYGWRRYKDGGWYQQAGEDSEKEAIENVWRGREYEMRQREKPENQPYHLANPELCKESL